MESMNDYKDRKPPYCEGINGWYKTKQKFWEEGYELYLNKEKWCYNFEYEDTVGDWEQSFLSQMIFGNLLKSQGYNDFSVNRYFMYVNGRDNKNICFHFDVMNNPKTNHELGKNAEKKVEYKRKIWEKRYYTIGNFTPIPWPENLQIKHRGAQERWDKLLGYCKDNWYKWYECIVDISFNEYMKRTCQHLYFKKIFSEFKNEYAKKLDKITPEEWGKLIQKWNNEIDKDDSMEIISFEGEIEEIVDNINFLIEARGRCIISLLRQELSENK